MSPTTLVSFPLLPQLFQIFDWLTVFLTPERISLQDSTLDKPQVISANANRSFRLTHSPDASRLHPKSLKFPHPPEDAFETLGQRFQSILSSSKARAKQTNLPKVDKLHNRDNQTHRRFSSDIWGDVLSASNVSSVACACHIASHQPNKSACCSEPLIPSIFFLKLFSLLGVLLDVLWSSSLELNLQPLE